DAIFQIRFQTMQEIAPPKGIILKPFQIFLIQLLYTLAHIHNGTAILLLPEGDIYFRLCIPNEGNRLPGKYFNDMNWKFAREIPKLPSHLCTCFYSCGAISYKILRKMFRIDHRFKYFF